MRIEAVLIADLLGGSSLVCLPNDGVEGGADPAQSGGTVPAEPKANSLRLRNSSA